MSSPTSKQILLAGTLAVFAGIQWLRPKPKPKPKAKALVVIGSVNADIVMEVDRLPAPGETLASTKLDTSWFPGGKGANTAVAAARISKSTVEFAGRFGNDSHAQTLRNKILSSGCSLRLSSSPQDPNCTTGQAYIFLLQGGDNSIVIVGGANQSWEPQLSSTLSSAVANAGMVMLQREISDHVNVQVVDLAAKHNVKVLQDLGGKDTPLAPELISKLFCVAPNETELSRITGLPTETYEEVLTAASWVQAQGCKTVLVTLGSRGSVFVDEDGKVHRGGVYPVPRVADTTGAGDCFRGAFAVALLEGNSYADCLQWGAAAASISVQMKGAMNSLPTRAAVEEVRRAGGYSIPGTF